MSKIAIVTDSNSGITQEEGRRLGVSVIPMPFFINEKMYLEGITLRQDEFYQWLKSDASISTSQPSPGETMGLWDNLLKEYDEIVQIPMSSGLSATCATAMGLAQEYEGRVHVVDNQTISVTQRQSVVDAIALRDAGKSGAEIKKILEEEKFNSSIYITLETLKYLKKGGRITPAAAAIGTVLNLKPVLQLQGEKLDAFAKVRGKKQARRTMLKAMKADFEGRFAPFVQNGDDLRKGIVVAVRHNGSAAASHGFYAVSRGKPLCRHRQHGEIVVFVPGAVDMIHGDPQTLCQTSYHSSLAGALPGDLQQSPVGEKHLVVR